MKRLKKINKNRYINKAIFKSIILSILFSLSLFSCSNDDVDDVIVTPEVNIRLSNYSVGSREYNISYSDNNQVTNYSNDPSFAGNIIYNADNQVIQIGRYSYTYNAQGRISEISEADDTSIINKESTIIYNNAGLIANQTLRFEYASSGDIVYVRRTYEYNGSNQLIHITEIESGTTNYTRDALTYDSNGNVVQRIRQRSLDGVSFTDEQTTNYTYDNKKNPGQQILENIAGPSNFSSIYLHNLTTMNFSNYAFFRLIYFSNNNLASVFGNYRTGSTSKTYNYIYNEEGYPISVEINRIDIDGTTSTSYRTWTYETF